MEIGDATNEALENEDKVKETTLKNFINSKLSDAVLKYFREVTLQMSRLVKRVIDLEKGPIDKIRIR